MVVKLQLLIIGVTQLALPNQRNEHGVYVFYTAEIPRFKCEEN